MKAKQNDLLLIDTALLGLLDKYLISEWCSMIPTPPVESAEARMYLHRRRGLSPDSVVKLRSLEARWNPGVAKASNCKTSKSFCAFALRC
jgi:hypothetical protein